MNDQQWQLWCQAQVGVQNALDNIVILLQEISDKIPARSSSFEIEPFSYDDSKDG